MYGEFSPVVVRQSRWCPARIVVVSKVMVWQLRCGESVLGAISCAMVRQSWSVMFGRGQAWRVTVMYVPFSHGKAVLVGHCMLGSCTVCLGLSGSGSRGLSCRGHVRCSKEWIGSRGVLWRVPLWNGAVLQSCLGSDSHCMYGYGSHGVEVEDRQVRSMQGRAGCCWVVRVLARQSW